MRLRKNKTLVIRRPWLFALAALMLAGVMLGGCEKKIKVENFEVTPDKVKLAWKFKTNDELHYSPIAKDGKVFVISMDRHLYAIDQQTGKLVWKFLPDELMVWDGSLSVVGGVAYFGTKGGYYYAVNTADGKKLWKASLGINSVKKAAFHEGKLYIPTTYIWPMKIKSNPQGKAKLFVVDASSGKLVNEFQTGNYLMTQPHIYQNIIFVPGSFLGPRQGDESGWQRIYALALNGLKEHWAYESHDGNVKSSAAGNGIYNYLGYNDYIVGVDLATGKKKWGTHTGNWAFGFTATDDMIIFGPANNKVVALNQKTGKKIWKHIIPDTRNLSGIMGIPVVQGDIVYWINHRLHILTAANIKDGKTLWHAQLQFSDGSMPNPDISGDMVFVSSKKDGTLYAYQIQK